MLGCLKKITVGGGTESNFGEIGFSEIKPLKI
jgi:hypothetical protein